MIVVDHEYNPIMRFSFSSSYSLILSRLFGGFVNHNDMLACTINSICFSHTARTLELDLCLDLLWRSLRFSGVNYGLSLDLTESMNLALIHWNEAIAPSLRGSHNSLSLGGCLYHCLRLCLRVSKHGEAD